MACVAAIQPCTLIDMSRHVLITGSSTGIGRACALHLATNGWTVHAGVRKAADGQALQREAGNTLRSIVLDITDAASIASAAAEIHQRVGTAGLSGLVNNAGVCFFGPVETVSIDEWRKQFEINVFGQIAVTQAMLPILRAGVSASGTAAIVMMSSIAGRVGQPILGPYCASKFALEAVSDALRCELAADKISVSILEPGAIKSEIWRKAQEDAQSMDRNNPAYERYRLIMDGTAKIAMEAEQRAVPAIRVAREVERCLTLRRPPIRRLIGFDAKMSAQMAKVMPRRMFDRLLIAVMSKKGRPG